MEYSLSGEVTTDDNWFACSVVTSLCNVVIWCGGLLSDRLVCAVESCTVLVVLSLTSTIDVTGSTYTTDVPRPTNIQSRSASLVWSLHSYFHFDLIYWAFTYKFCKLVLNQMQVFASYQITLYHLDQVRINDTKFFHRVILLCLYRASTSANPDGPNPKSPIQDPKPP